MQTKKILWVIFFTLFMDMLGIGILVPIYPSLVVLGSPNRVVPSTWSVSDGFILIGWLIGMYPLFQFFCTPILGQLSDRVGRKKILTLSILGTSFSYVLFAIGILTKNLPLMFFSRILDGITGGNISIAQAVIGDVSLAKDRAKNFGLIGMCIGAGFVFGPFLGGKLSDPSVFHGFGVATPFWFAALLSLVNFILVLKILPETLKIKSSKPINFTKPFNNILKGFWDNQLNHVIIPIFFFNIGFALFSTFWGIVLADKFGLSRGQIGDFFAYSGIMIILAQGLFVRRLSGKVADYKVLRYSIIGIGIALIVNYLIPYDHPQWIYYVPIFVAVFASLTKAFSSSLLVRISHEDNRGMVMGINSSAFALSQIIAAISSGYLAIGHAAIPILVGGVVAIGGGILFIKWFDADKILG